uniref:Laccase VV-LAC6 n=1 Tax=Volvariella volvacea TaxID=36659 RepID=A0A097DBJ4_9AGAR|nr:laccase VV-LAC6 [Volvariella volvacea]
MLLPTLVALSTLIAFSAASLGPVTTLVIENAKIDPDGFTRGATVVNGLHPGPLIAAKKGSKFRVTTLNKLNDTEQLLPTSIHWHGLLQNRTSYMDGVASVTQCPIAPSKGFVYEFAAPGQAGTFWYHSHFSTQYCDGLRGPLVLYDPEDPHRDLYDIDDEGTIISLTDWYHVKSPETGPGATPDSTLINGRGRYLVGSDGQDPIVSTAPLSKVIVASGYRFRFRLINMACEDNFVFSIDGHNMTIIEADGVNTKPLTVDSIQIYAGQRYSIVVNADQPVGNYWIRANPSLGTTGFYGGLNSAILRYKGAPMEDPKTPYKPSTNPLYEYNLRNLVPNEVPGTKPGYVSPPDVSLTLDSDFNFDIMKFTINGVPFEPPQAPVLLQLLSGIRPPAVLPNGTIELKRNQVVEITMPGGAPGGPHPFHLHGHTFDVVRSAGSPTVNYVDPVRRDVVNIGDEGQNVTIRFMTDNPGPWILHCHIDWHLELGLAVVFAEDPSSITPPPGNIRDAWALLCPGYDGPLPV